MARTGVGGVARRYLPLFLGGIPVIVIPALEWLPMIPERSRPWIIIGTLLIAAIGVWWLDRDRRRNDDLADENRQLKADLEKAEPEDLLQHVAGALFRAGAWRLTVYKKAHSSDPAVGDHLVKLASAASDGDQSDLGPSRVLIQPRTQFQLLFSLNLADSTYRRAEESGSFLDDVQSEAWIKWHDGIFGAPDQDAPDRSTFRARKYAWYAAQDPRSHVVFAAIAESADPEGIVKDNLEHRLTPAWIIFACQLAEMRSRVIASNAERTRSA